MQSLSAQCFSWDFFKEAASSRSEQCFSCSQTSYSHGTGSSSRYHIEIISSWEHTISHNGYCSSGRQNTESTPLSDSCVSKIRLFLRTTEKIVNSQKKRKLHLKLPLVVICAVGETRTRTGLLPLPPQSSVSTISPPPLLNWDCKYTCFFYICKIFRCFFTFFMQLFDFCPIHGLRKA